MRLDLERETHANGRVAGTQRHRHWREEGHAGRAFCAGVETLKSGRETCDADNPCRNLKPKQRNSKQQVQG